jgi:hypothetical protein
MSAMPQGGGLAGLGQPSPEELLGQIRDLLDQYLALGDNTPVAAQAQQLAQAIDQTAGGAATAQGDLGAPPEDAGGVQPTVPQENQMGAGDITQSGADEEPPPGNEKTYGKANESALKRLQKRNKDQGR